MYLAKFANSFPDDETVNEWCTLWGEALAGVTADQIKYGLSYCAIKHEWPPTSAEFRACCEALPKPRTVLPMPPRTESSKARERIAKIREMLANPRPAGKWWAEEIIAKHEAGERVHDTALRMAREALA